MNMTYQNNIVLIFKASIMKVFTRILITNVKFNCNCSRDTGSYFSTYRMNDFIFILIWTKLSYC